MKNFDVTIKPIHYFNVIVPNFSTVDSMVLEIDYNQYKIIGDLYTLLTFDSTDIFVNNITIEEEMVENLNLPVEVKSITRIDAEIITKYIYSSEILKDVPIYLGNKVDGTLYSKEPVSSTLKSKLTIEVEPIVAGLVKLYEIDDLTWEDLDGKMLENIYYKTIN